MFAVQSEEPYQCQSSVDDTTTTSDSTIADLEVSNILNTVEQPPQKTELISKPPADDPVKKTNPFASLKAKFCSAHFAVNRSIGLLSEASGKIKKDEGSSERIIKKDWEVLEEVRRNSDQSIRAKEKSGHAKRDKHSPKDLRRQKKDVSFSKSTSFLTDKKPGTNLRIRICKCSDSKCGKRQFSSNCCGKSNFSLWSGHHKVHTIETDSSNEYESETGIPKSPTLFISGVSISRTPEPKSPGLGLHIAASDGCRQSRSSSLSVPLTSRPLTASSASLNSSPKPRPRSPAHTTPTTRSPSHNKENNSGGGKSKSASEPEREREMFRFPKSSTDGALSSVLHVQESNLSSDDFHEALFLLERSPKTRDSKRRRKAKKKEERKEDSSSAL